MLRILKQSKKSSARLTRITTQHGSLTGPFFMPIATRGAVKHLTTDDMHQLNAQIILSNTYHLLLRPGMTLMKKYGGLHNFMDWSGPILTDSGGYQVFSLAKHRTITERGAHFQDPQNGKKYFLTPEKVIAIQKTIGSDIMMVLDECPPYPTTHAYAKKSLELTTRWAQRSLQEHKKESGYHKMFAIVQGSVFEDLRKISAEQLVELDCDGYAIGGVAVGEPRDTLPAILEWTVPLLPKNKPRYLMGLGRPEEIVHAVRQGIDMFDCVIPTREARHGRLYMRTQRPLSHKNFYTTTNIANAKYRHDLSPINQTNLQNYSKAYLHHLFKTKEPLAMRLATLHNLDFYLGLMRDIRHHIKHGQL